MTLECFRRNIANASLLGALGLAFAGLGIFTAGLALLAWAVNTAPTPATPATRATAMTVPAGTPEFEKVLAGYLSDATARLARVVLDPPGSTPGSKDFRRARSAQLLGQIDRIRQTVKADVSALVGANLPNAYAAGIAQGLRHGRDLAVAQGLPIRGEVLRGGFSTIDVNALQVVVADTVSDVHRALDGTAERASNLLRRTAANGLSTADINAVVARGLLTGDLATAGRDLRADLRKIHGETLTITDRNGDPMEFSVGHYANLVVRTRTREAQVLGKHKRFEQLGLDLVRVIGRVSDNPCTAFLFKVYSLSGRHPTYPAYSELPPIPMHPNCSKSTQPFVESFASPAELAVAAPDDDTAALHGRPFGQMARPFKDLQMRAQVGGRFTSLGATAATATEAPTPKAAKTARATTAAAVKAARPAATPASAQSRPAATSRREVPARAERIAKGGGNVGRGPTAEQIEAKTREIEAKAAAVRENNARLAAELAERRARIATLDAKLAEQLARNTEGDRLAAKLAEYAKADKAVKRALAAEDRARDRSVDRRPAGPGGIRRDGTIRDPGAELLKAQRRTRAALERRRNIPPT